MDCILFAADACFVVWSNFEIGDLDLWRGEAYSKFFDFLDSKGGFYYEVCYSSLSFHRLMTRDLNSDGVTRLYTA